MHLLTSPHACVHVAAIEDMHACKGRVKSLCGGICHAALPSLLPECRAWQNIVHLFVPARCKSLVINVRMCVHVYVMMIMLPIDEPCKQTTH
jgi:hypothetical protein